MEAQTISPPRPTTTADGPPPHILLQTRRAVGAMRRAMLAVRAIGRKADAFNCLLRHTGPKQAGRSLEVLSTDGLRLMAFRVQTDGAADTPKLDHGISKEAMRLLANLPASTEAIGIVTDGDSVLISTTPAEGPWRKFEVPEKVAGKVYDNVFKDFERNSRGCVATTVLDRKRALEAVRNMPWHGRPLYRFVLGPGGLNGWSTTAEKVGPLFPADAVLSTEADGCGEPMTFGLERSSLTDALRTMSGKTLSLTMIETGRPVYLVSTDGRERYLIQTVHLQ